MNILKKLSAKSQIALGQSGLIVTLLLTAVLFGLLPDRLGAVRDGRAALAEALAANSSAFLTYSDLRRIEANLKLVTERNEDILSAGLRRADGNLQLEVGEHQQQWQPRSGEYSTDSQLVVPIQAGDKAWGHLELRFTPVKAEGLLGVLDSPWLLLCVFLGVGSFIAFYFYLGRMLAQLDPSQAIPGRVRSALDTMAEGLLVLDNKQNIVLANLAFAEMLGEDPDKLVGTKADQLPWILDEDSFQEQGMYPWTQAISSGDALVGTPISLDLPGGVRKVFKSNSSPVLGTKGNYAGVLVSFDDITELEEKKVELSQSKEEAEAANEAKSAFLSNMSHEIRTPMNAILGFAEVLQRGYSSDPATNQKHLGTILSSGRHLLTLINDILDLSKVEAGRLEVEEIDCAAHEVIAETVKVLEVKAEEKGIYLKFEPEGELPEIIQSDSARLRQIVTNLVGNAIKFTEKGGVSVRLRYIAKPQSMLQFDIIDTGIGMEQSRLDSIFDPFVQADTSVARRFGGTGLGLSISKRFAEALGGGIEVRSKPGKGSVFRCTVRTGDLEGVEFLPAETLLERIKTTTVVTATSWEFPAARILVVDDGAENRELVKLLLEENGLQIDEACNGQEGVDKACSTDYDVILMDVQMPVMDGFEATRTLRQRGHETPIVALTANAMKGFEQQCLDAGYSGYVSKPIDIDRLLAEIASLVGATEGETKVVTPTQLVVAPGVATAADGGAEIYSRLTDTRFRPLIEQFANRLDEQISGMKLALQRDDLQEMADLAHWLKGAGGTVGFNDFTEPAAELEIAARGEDGEAVRQRLNEIIDLRDRLSTRQLNDEEWQEIERVSVEAANEDLVLDDTGPISSRFADDARMAPLINKFQVRLLDQLQQMRNCCDAQNFSELADLAHWLKGAGGTIGFDVFTEPSAELEIHAKEQDRAACIAALNKLDGLALRVVFQDPPAEGAA